MAIPQNAFDTTKAPAPKSGGGLVGSIVGAADNVGKGVVSAAKWAAPQVLPVGGAILGGTLGAAGGALIPGAGETGASEIAGGMAGAGIGGAVGQYAEDAIENLFHPNKDFNKLPELGKVATTGVASTVAEGVGRAVFSKPMADILTKGISIVAGYPEEVVKAALQDPQSLVPGFKKGAQGLSDMVKKVGASLGEQSGKLNDWFGEQLSKFGTTGIQGGKDAVDALIKNIDTNILKSTENGIVPSTNFSAQKGGYLSMDNKLNFNNSTIIEKTAQNKITQAYNFLLDLKNNPTAEGLNNAVVKIGKLWSSDKSGIKAETPILGKMLHTLNDFIHGVGDDFQGLGHQELAKLRDQYAPAKAVLDNMGDIIPKSTKLSTEEIRGAIKKLVSLTSDPYALETKGAIDKFGSKIGEDIGNMTKGAILKERGVKGGMPVQSIPGIFTKMIRLLPSELLKVPVKIAGMEGNATSIIKNLIQWGASEDVIRAFITQIIQANAKK